MPMDLYLQIYLAAVHEQKYQEHYHEIGKREPHTVIVAHVLLQPVAERARYAAEVDSLAHDIGRY